MAHQLRFGLLLLPLFALACPDSEARFDAFIDSTKDSRMDADEESGESESAGTEETGVDGVPDMTGTYLFALETALALDVPLQFVTTVTMTTNDDGTAVAIFDFQPLSLDMGSQDTPREFVGESLAFPDIAFDMTGNFEIPMGVTMVTGEANPVTGSAITADLTIHGHIVHIDAMCGDITGMLMNPLEYDLAGSTFAMLRLADDGSDPASLPAAMTFPYRCSQVPAGPGDGDGDTTDTGDTTDSGTDTGTDTGTESTT